MEEEYDSIVPGVGGAILQSPKLYQSPPKKTQSDPLPSSPQFVQKTINPSAGFIIAFRSLNVILGSKTPLSEELTSRMAEE